MDLFTFGYGRITDEYNLTTEQLKVKENRLNELDAMVYDINNEAQQLRAENSEISISLRQASDATNEYRSQVNLGKGIRARLDQENEQLRETMRREATAMPAKMRGAETWTDSDVEESSAAVVRNSIQGRADEVRREVSRSKG